MRKTAEEIAGEMVSETFEAKMAGDWYAVMGDSKEVPNDVYQSVLIRTRGDEKAARIVEVNTRAILARLIERVRAEEAERAKALTTALREAIHIAETLALALSVEHGKPMPMSAKLDSLRRVLEGGG